MTKNTIVSFVMTKAVSNREIYFINPIPDTLFCNLFENDPPPLIFKTLETQR